METRYSKTISWILVPILVALWFTQVEGQSCGPRVSARLLAEIPCDMSKSSYCSAPGSAYPWSSVKRYINDNQGLVRRMYGDEKHSSVLLNEIDHLRSKFDQLQTYMNRGYSRTEYGRSAKGRSSRGSRRQPRPQIFDDEDETPATIFRVVTETSIKVGDPVTRPSVRETPTTSYEPATGYEAITPGQTPTTPDVTGDDNATTSGGTTVTDGTTTTEYTTTTTRYTTTAELPTTTETEPTDEATTTLRMTTTTVAEDLPVAMERIGYEDIDDYDYEPSRKVNSAVLQNSVEEKDQLKQGVVNVKKSDPNKYNEEESMYVVSVDDATEKAAGNESTAKDKSEEEVEEEVPRRGINACPVKNEVIAPYWANNTRGETLALLNVHPFEQYVHFEKCAFENHQMLCREGCRCEQQYRLHRLLAFDPKNECRGIFSDWFRFPSCCVCICYDLTPDIPRTRSRKGRMK